MAQTKIKASGFDVDVITGTTALAATPADTDEILVSDNGTLKRIDYSYVKTDLTAVADGSAGSPSIANSGDTHTGIYFPAEDFVGITNAGALTAQFKDATTTPAGLELSQSGGGDGIFLKGPGAGEAAVVQIVGFEAYGAALEFMQDQGDDNADKWSIGNAAGFFGIDAQGVQDNFYFTDRDGGSTDNEAKLEHSGAWSTEGAQNASTTVDYAEFFEWKTALASDDKVTETYGMAVVLDGDKVRLAEAGEEAKVLGVIRPNGTSAMVGGSHTFKWKDKYETDVWGVVQKENYIQATWFDAEGYKQSHPKDRIPSGIPVPTTDEEKTARKYSERNTYARDKGAHKKGDLLMRKKLNSSYDASKTYVDRENRRKEWAIVGLLGQVPIRNTAVIPTTWTKMKNIETGLDLYYIK